jgi:L-alanine-DL-glutamate epimerase-like enolase superfamily enzyme
MPRIESIRPQGRRSAGTCDFVRCADSIETRVWCLVKVRSSNGVEGIGFCYSAARAASRYVWQSRVACASSARKRFLCR